MHSRQLLEIFVVLSFVIFFVATFTNYEEIAAFNFLYIYV